MFLIVGHVNSFIDGARGKINRQVESRHQYNSNTRNTSSTSKCLSGIATGSKMSAVWHQDMQRNVSWRQDTATKQEKPHLSTSSRILLRCAVRPRGQGTRVPAEPLRPPAGTPLSAVRSAGIVSIASNHLANLQISCSYRCVRD
jgi:hypothetical protein